MALINQETIKKVQQQVATTNASSFSATSITFNQPFDSNIHEEIYNQTDEYTGYKSAHDAANDLFRNSNGLYDRRILDNARNIEKNLINNEEWRVDTRKDMNGDGKIDNNDIVNEDLNNDGKIDENDSCESIALVDAIVDSFDSELDLYIEEQFNQIIEKYGPNCTYNLRAMFGSPNSPAIVELAKLGIRADAVGDHDVWQNRTYALSLVDMSDLPENATDEEILAHVYADDAEILQDAQGNKGSIIFADCLTADGTAQGAEMNLSSMLDQLGYECVSKADYMGKEQEYQDLLQNIKAGLDNNLYKGSNATIEAVYGRTLTMSQAVCAVYGINGNAYGVEGWFCKARTFEQTQNAVEALGDNLYHLTCGKIDLDGDGEISEIEIAKALETIQTNEETASGTEGKKDEDGKNAATIVDNSNNQTSVSSASTLDMTQLYSDAEKEFESRLEEEQKENPEVSEEEIAKKVAEEFGVDEDTLLYNYKH